MEKSKMVLKVAVLVGGFSTMASLSACGAAGIMNVTERAPRPDPAVESGQVENPVEVREDEDALVEEESPESTPPEDSSLEAAPPATAGDDGESGGMAPRSGPDASPGSLDPVEDGVRRVGDAGEVEFRVENGVLNLTNVSANDGWDYQLGKQDFDEVKVFFAGNDARWEFEAELDDTNVLEVQTKQEIPFAEAGTYEVGEAGEVSFSARDGGIILDDYRVADGWSANVEENDFEDVHLKFDDGSGTEYKFEAEFDDGTIEVEIERKERGPIAAT